MFAYATSQLLMAMLALHGCSQSTQNDSGTDVPMASETATDAGPGIDCPPPGYVHLSADAGADATCYRASSCDNQPFCPARVANDRQRPAFIITQGDYQRPRILNPTNPAGVIINSALATSLIRWGFVLDVAAGTFRTGSLAHGPTPQPGVGVYESTFRFSIDEAPPLDGGTGIDRRNPATTTLTLVDEVFSSGLIPRLVIAIGPAAGEIPWRDVQFRNVRLRSGRNCIGLARPAFDACNANRWFTTVASPAGTPEPSGVVEGTISVSDARGVNIDMIMGVSTFCDILAGTSCTNDPATWPSPPDTVVDGAASPNAWRVVVHIAAVAIRIE